MKTEWSVTTKHIVSVGLVVFGLYILYLSQSVLTLVIIAALVAFLLNPIVLLLHHRLKLPRGAAVLVTYLLAVIVILLSPLIFLPPIINGFNFLAGINYEVLIEDSLSWTEQTLLSLKDFNTQISGVNLNFDSIVDPALGLLQNAGQDITPELPSFETIINSMRSAITVTFGVATNLAGTVFSGALTLIVLVLSAIYISLDGYRFTDRFLRIVPVPYQDEAQTLIKRLNRTWRAYFRGQLNLMLIIGTVTWLGNTALGLPGAFALGVIAGLMELIPNLGPFLAAIPAVIVALLQGSSYLGVSNWVFALIIVGFYVLVQQFENTFVVPRVLGDAVDLHPLVVIIGVLIGTNVGGILGALLAAPVIASGREIIRYLYLKILSEPPFPPNSQEEEEPESAWWQQIKSLFQTLRQRVASRSTPKTSMEMQELPPQNVEENQP